MSKNSMVLRDLIASVITTDGTINGVQSTATDLVRAVIDESGDPAIKISLSGGGGGTGSTLTLANLNITGDLHVSGNTYEHDQYLVDDLFTDKIGSTTPGGAITLSSPIHGTDASFSTLYVSGQTTVGSLYVEGYQQFRYTIAGASTDLTGNTTDMQFYHVTNACELYLPPATGSGLLCKVKSSTANTVNVYANGTDHIDNTTFKNLVQWACLSLVDAEAGLWLVI